MKNVDGRRKKGSLYYYYFLTPIISNNLSEDERQHDDDYYFSHFFRPSFLFHLFVAVVVVVDKFHNGRLRDPSLCLALPFLSKRVVPHRIPTRSQEKQKAHLWRKGQ